MPTYTFLNTETEESFDEIMSWDARTEFLETNPHIQPVVTAARISFQGNLKVDDGFKEVLSKIGEAHPSSVVGEAHRKNKTIKEVKTRTAYDKYVS